MNTGYITVDDLGPGDNLHPSAEGYVKMAEVWYAAIYASLDKLGAPIPV
jgi:lysophospholipase L1-like esterase